MATIAKSGEDMYFSQISFSRRGISNWQGPHHVAQKLITTTFPFSLAREKVLPEVSWTVMAGIGSPTLVWAALSASEPPAFTLPQSSRRAHVREKANFFIFGLVEPRISWSLGLHG